jgi:hypothetical protein
MLIRELLAESRQLKEAKGHLDHPEDLVFLQDASGIQRAIDAIVNTASQPKAITIKWDGYPALIFGRGSDGNFTIMDKHMFNKADPAVRQLHSPQQWMQYEQARGERARSNLVSIVTELWPGLERATNGATGYYWGDLLFSQPLAADNGLYKFRANPNGIAYTVEVDSPLGNLMTNKSAGIAVHQYLDPNATSTDMAQPLNGTIGRLKNNSNVAIIPSAMPTVPKVAVNQTLLQRAKAAQQRYGQAITDFMNNAPQSRTQFEQLFTTYINSKIVSGNLQNLVTDFYKYFETRPMTERMRAKLAEYFRTHTGQVRALFAVWIAIYNLKMNVVKQLDRAAKSSPVKGYLQDGTQTQEGFVSSGLKFVNRMGFARQNLAGRQQTKLTEAIDNKQELVIYPGGFHPFHLGHASVFDHLAHKFSNGEVFVAATDTKTERPFGFEDKKFLANQSGVPKNRFVQVKSPYRAEEITKQYDPNSTILVFAVSEKDRDRFNFAPKKDGSPSYFQPYEDGVSEPMSKHGYIYVVPKIDFQIAGQSIDSASKIRQMYTAADDATRTQIIQDLYPLGKAPKRIKRILDSVLGGLTEFYLGDKNNTIKEVYLPLTPKQHAGKRNYEAIKRSSKNNSKCTIVVFDPLVRDFDPKKGKRFTLDAMITKQLYDNVLDRIVNQRQQLPTYENLTSLVKIADMLSNKSDIKEADNPNYFGGSSMSPIPGTPQSLRVVPKEELKKQREQEREDRKLRKFMGRSHH